MLPSTSFERALNAIGEGRLDAARGLLQDILETDDGNYRAMFFLAWSLKLLGDKFLSSQLFSIGVKMAEEADDDAFVTMFRAESNLPV